MKTSWRWLRKIPVVVWKDISNASQIIWAHLKAIWWLKYLLFIAVGIVVLAIWTNPNDWIIALGVAVTFLLAIAAFLSILDNRHARKLDRRERLLNEIIEWASNVSRAAISRQMRDPHALWSTKLEYKYQKSKGKYVAQIINLSFPELTQLYLDIDIKINEAISFTEDVINHNASKSDLIDYETRLTQSVEKLFEDAAKIRNKV